MSFNNTRYFTRQSFDILSSSLKVHKRGLFDEIEYEIPFDNIHNKKTLQVAINNNLIYAGIFFIIISFLFLLGTAQELTYILFCAGVLFILIAFVNRKKMVSIHTYSGGSIDLYFTNNNREQIVDFANQVIDASNNHLMKKYSNVDRLLPIEPQIEHLQFLRNREILSERDFEILKNKLLGREGKSSIGFN